MGDAGRVAARWAEAYNSHDEQQLLSVLAPDATLIGPEGRFQGAEAITRYMMAWVDAFGGGYTTEHVTVDGDVAVQEMTWRGVHDGTYVTAAGDIPPTGRAVEARSSHTVVASGDRVAEVRMYFDVHDFLSQLGLLSTAVT